jgi:hypothetical protein
MLDVFVPIPKMGAVNEDFMKIGVGFGILRAVTLAYEVLIKARIRLLARIDISDEDKRPVPERVLAFARIEE